MTITTDPKKFQYELRELYVQVSLKVTAVSVDAVTGSEGRGGLMKLADSGHPRRLEGVYC